MIRRWFLAILIGILSGAFTLNPLLTAELPFGRLRANDLVVLTAFFYAVQYLAKSRNRGVLTGADDGLKLSVLYSVMIVLMGLVSRTSETSWGGNELIANLRGLLYYGTFFYVLSLVHSTADVRFTIRILLVYAAIGSTLTIIQSFYGPTPLFGASMSADSDMHSFYQISTWSQTDSIGDVLTRVNLPIINVILWAFFFTVNDLSRRAQISRLLFVFLLAAALFINYARGLFVGILLALFVLLALRSRQRASFGRVLSTFLKIGIGCLIGFLCLDILFGFNVLSVIVERLAAGGYDISTSSGTWDFRMNELASYLSLDLSLSEVVFGFGLFPQNSPIGLSYIHFGFGDLMYRGGIVNSILLIVFIVWSMRYFHRKVSGNDSFVGRLSLPPLLSTVTYIGFFVSANQFWSEFFYSSMGAVTALLYFVSVCKENSAGNGIGSPTNRDAANDSIQ